jgi:cupin superfamily acireductone dioxygenase involved in methionine salvage
LAIVETFAKIRELARTVSELSETHEQPKQKTLMQKSGHKQRDFVRTHNRAKSSQKTVKKYTLVSSHTARRVGATNTYFAGIPIFRIMLILLFY